MQFGGGRVKCDFNYLNFPLLVYLRGLSTSLKFSRSSAQLMWLSCWLFTFNCQHSCTSCLGDKFILIDIEINKSYFKLVQLWWTHNLSDLSLSQQQIKFLKVLSIFFRGHIWAHSYRIHWAHKTLPSLSQGLYYAQSQIWPARSKHVDCWMNLIFRSKQYICENLQNSTFFSNF